MGIKKDKKSAEKSVSWARGKALEIPIGNLVLLHDHPEGHNKIQGNYKNVLFGIELKHQDPNVYIIKPCNGKGPMCTVNWQQLFNLHKSQGSDMPSNPASDTNLPILLVKKPIGGLTTPQHVHPYGTRSKTQANSMILQSSSEDETEDPSILESSLEDTGSYGVMGNLFTAFRLNYGSKEVAGS